MSCAPFIWIVIALLVLFGNAKIYGFYLNFRGYLSWLKTWKIQHVVVFPNRTRIPLAYDLSWTLFTWTDVTDDLILNYLSFLGSDWRHLYLLFSWCSHFEFHKFLERFVAFKICFTMQRWRFLNQIWRFEIALKVDNWLIQHLSLFLGECVLFILDYNHSQLFEDVTTRKMLNKILGLKLWPITVVVDVK